MGREKLINPVIRLQLQQLTSISIQGFDQLMTEKLAINRGRTHSNYRLSSDAKFLFLFFKVSTDNQGGTEQHVVIKGKTKCLGCWWVFSCKPNGVQSVLFVRIQTRVPQASRHVYRSEFQTEVSKKHQDFLSIHLVLQYGDQFVGAQRSMIIRCVNVVLNHDKRILVKLIFPMINYMEFAINQKRL